MEPGLRERRIGHRFRCLPRTCCVPETMEVERRDWISLHHDQRRSAAIAPPHAVSSSREGGGEEQEGVSAVVVAVRSDWSTLSDTAPFGSISASKQLPTLSRSAGLRLTSNLQRCLQPCHVRLCWHPETFSPSCSGGNISENVSMVMATPHGNAGPSSVAHAFVPLQTKEIRSNTFLT